MNREAIAEAVYTRLAEIDGVRTSSRRPVMFDQVSPSDCPALYMGIGSSQVVGKIGSRPLWRLEFLAYVYVHDGSKDGPSEQLNSMLGLIDDAFRADETDLEIPGASREVTTLGGLVQYARPVSVQTDEGSFGDQGVAVVTIEVSAAG